MRKELTEECPACGGQLRGSRFTGYQCGNCGAYFSARHIAHTRKQLFSELVAKHFPEKTVVQEISSGPAKKQAAVERVDVIIEDKAGKIERAIAEAKESARIASRHLEDVLTSVEELPDPADVRAAISIEEDKIIVDSPPRKFSKAGIAGKLGITKKALSKKTKNLSSKKNITKTTKTPKAKPETKTKMKPKKTRKAAPKKRSRKR